MHNCHRGGTATCLRLDNRPPILCRMMRIRHAINIKGELDRVHTKLDRDLADLRRYNSIQIQRRLLSLCTRLLGLCMQLLGRAERRGRAQQRRSGVRSLCPRPRPRSLSRRPLRYLPRAAASPWTPGRAW